MNLDQMIEPFKAAYLEQVELHNKTLDDLAASQQQVQELKDEVGILHLDLADKNDRLMVAREALASFIEQRNKIACEAIEANGKLSAMTQERDELEDELASALVDLYREVRVGNDYLQRITDLESTIKSHGIPVKSYCGGMAHYCTKEES